MITDEPPNASAESAPPEMILTMSGNTATTATKEAELNTGLVVRVPLFIDEGDIVIVSTKDGKYVSRK